VTQPPSRITGWRSAFAAAPLRRTTFAGVACQSESWLAHPKLVGLEVRLRGCAASADNLRRRGLPTGAHAPVAKRERRLAERVGFVPLDCPTISDLGVL